MNFLHRLCRAPRTCALALAWCLALGLGFGPSITLADPDRPPQSTLLGTLKRDASGQIIVVPFDTPEPTLSATMSVDAPPPRTLRVGPRQALKRIADAAKLAHDGDTIEIEAGDYPADVAVWNQPRLTLRGVGGHARLIANGASAEGKALWVIRGADITVENIEFTGARVAHRNGAGIRFEQGKLTVRNCRFIDNENGILTASGPLQLTVIDSEFGHNGHGDGYSHHLYAGDIDRLEVTGSYFHHGRVGHLIKSRAKHSRILYNRLSDEAGGRASYEIDLPNGGQALVAGNIIEQSADTENPTLVSFGVEGYRHPGSMLELHHNTWINNRASGGRALLVAPGEGRVIAMNNVFIGPYTDIPPSPHPQVEHINSVVAEAKDVVALKRLDLRPIKGRGLTRNTPVNPATRGLDFMLTKEYDHPASTRSIAPPLLPGAVQTWFSLSP